MTNASKRPQTCGKVRGERTNGRRHPAKCEESEQMAADIRQSCVHKVEKSCKFATLRFVFVERSLRANKRPQTSGNAAFIKLKSPANLQLYDLLSSNGPRGMAANEQIIKLVARLKRYNLYITSTRSTLRFHGFRANGRRHSKNTNHKVKNGCRILTLRRRLCRTLHAKSTLACGSEQQSPTLCHHVQLYG